MFDSWNDGSLTGQIFRPSSLGTKEICISFVLLHPWRRSEDPRRQPVAAEGFDKEIDRL